MPRKQTPRPLVGWREWVLFPDLSPVAIKAKVDTGARTSSLHAHGMSIETRGGREWALFEVNPIQRSRRQASHVEMPVETFRSVRSSSGHSSRRPVIRTPIRIGSQTYDIEITLTTRDELGFRVLLGRTALRGRFTVDPGRSYLHGLPTESDLLHPDGPMGG